MAEVAQCEMVLVSEAAIRLRLTREQVIRRIQSGEIAGGRVMGSWYVLRTALEQLIAGTQAGTEAGSAATDAMPNGATVCQARQP